MNTNQNTILRLAVAAAFAGGATMAHGVVNLNSPTAVKFANELPTTALALFNAAGDLSFSGNVISFAPTTGQSLTISATLSGGATFSGVPAANCVTSTGSPATTAAILNLGGDGTAVAVFTLSSAVTTATITGACTISASGIALAAGAHPTVAATITYQFGTLASSTVNGTIITFVKGASASISGAPTLTAQVTAGFLNFVGTVTTAALGTVFYASNGSARLDSTAAGLSATDVLASASLTAAGASLAGAKTTGGVYLVTAGATCAAGAVIASTGPAASVTFTNLSATLVSAGLTVCFSANGTSTIPIDSITANLVGFPVPVPAFSVNTALSPNVLATILRNGSSRRALNIPNVVNADQAFIRITNTSGLAGRVIGTLVGQDGVTLGTANTVLITAAAFTPNVTVILDAPTLKTAFGITTDWVGRAQLILNAETTSISVVNAIRAANGTLTNLSSESN